MQTESSAERDGYANLFKNQPGLYFAVHEVGARSSHRIIRQQTNTASESLPPDAPQDTIATRS